MRAIELFSGAGGLALGLEQAGFESVAMFEKNPHACATLRHNRPQWNVIEADVRSVDYRSFGPVELVAGGPPCQPFSMGGKARGAKDARDMFPEAARAIRQLQPLAFLFENVRGLLRPAFTNYVEFIRLQLRYPDFPITDGVAWDTNLQRLQKHHTSNNRHEELTYNVAIHAVDAADYGVPQRRQRVFFIGFRQDINARWHFPTPVASRENLHLAQFVTGSYWREHGLPTPVLAAPSGREPSSHSTPEFDLLRTGRWQTVRDAIRGLGDPRETGTPSNHLFQAGAKTYPGHTGSPLDEPAKALKAGDHGVPGGENMLRHPNGRVRYFTIRESARIQTFPDDFHFPGTWTESMRQLGNAVPVELARQVASSIFGHIRCHARPNCLQPVGQEESR